MHCCDYSEGRCEETRTRHSPQAGEFGSYSRLGTYYNVKPHLVWGGGRRGDQATAADEIFDICVVGYECTQPEGRADCCWCGGGGFYPPLRLLLLLGGPEGWIWPHAYTLAPVTQSSHQRPCVTLRYVIVTRCRRGGVPGSRHRILGAESVGHRALRTPASSCESRPTIPALWVLYLD